MRRYRRRIAIVMVILFLGVYLVPGGAGGFVEADSYTNLALQAVASASGVEGGTQFTADKVNDGVVNRGVKPGANQSRWASNLGLGTKWVQLAFENEVIFNEVVLEWERKNPIDYKVQYSQDGDTWQDLFVKSEKPADYTEVFRTDHDVAAKFLRVFIENFDPVGAPLGEEEVEWATVSLFEVEMYLRSEDDYAVNYALRRPAFSSDNETSDYTADKAVDGIVNRDAAKPQSRWASNTAGGTKWLKVDLEQERSMLSFVIEWERRNATKYRIEVADEDTAEAYRTVYEAEEPPKHYRERIILDELVSGRFVRLVIESYDRALDGDWFNVSVYELEVYGTEAPYTMQDVANSIDGMEVEQGVDILEMPDIGDDYTLDYIGTDYRYVIDEQRRVYTPVVDTYVQSDFTITDINSNEVLTLSTNVLVHGEKDSSTSVNERPETIPEIREWYGEEGNFTAGDEAVIVLDKRYYKELEDTGRIFAEDYTELFGVEPQVIAGEEKDALAGDFYFTLDAKGEGLQEEGYKIVIDDCVVVKAEEVTGAFWATRTILQIMLSEGTTSMPKGEMRDYPRFDIRGFMLDVGRKSFPIEYIQDLIKQMAWYKMNDLHLHLNDNYIFLEDYGTDAFSAYSGFRMESDIEGLTNTDVYYTKQEFRELIDQANAYGIQIVPEFDVPAHSLAFTKVRRDLAMGLSGRDADHLDLNNPDTLPFVKTLFSEYIDGDDPVFKNEVVHIGTDEYSSQYTEEFRKFTDDLIKYVRDEKNKTVRLWGSLTARNGSTPVSSENVQMNIWNFGWANPKDMYDQGYNLINTNDGQLYIVPGADYYYDYLNAQSLYNNWVPNVMSSTVIPAGSPQMLGGAYAVWNDNIDKKENGITRYDIMDRIVAPMPALSEKLWGMGEVKTYQELQEAAVKVGTVPNTTLFDQIKTIGEDVFSYKFEKSTVRDYSENEFHANDMVNVQFSDEGVTGDALKMQGGESYAELSLGQIGPKAVLEFYLKMEEDTSDSEQILFESKDAAIKANINGSGKLGFTREGRDFTFNYSIIPGEWVKVAIETEKDFTSLYINDEFVEKLGSSGRGTQYIHATFSMPIDRIGSSSDAFCGLLDNIRLVKGSWPLSDEAGIDKSALEELAEEAKQLTEKGHTQRSWEIMTEALEQAEIVLADNYVSQSEVNQAYVQLKNAIENLVKVDKDELEKLLDHALQFKEEDYTSDSWAVFITALVQARQTFNDRNAEQAEVNEAVLTLENAIKQLDEKTPEPGTDESDTEESESETDTEESESETDTEESESETDTEESESETDTEESESETDTEESESETDTEESESETDTEESESKTDTEESESKTDTGESESDTDTKDSKKNPGVDDTKKTAGKGKSSDGKKTPSTADNSQIILLLALMSVAIAVCVCTYKKQNNK